MVGVPRSKGCHRCVQRRVRCDQAKPRCGNCTRYGAECPGYDRSWKFVVGKHKIKQRQHDDPGPVQPGILITPTIDRGRYICTMLDSMYMAMPTGEAWFLGSLLDGIQARLGTQTTLDSATMSFILQVLGKANGDERLVGESRSLYGKSLTCLQGSLNHRSEWSTTETLCATTILCYFELFAGTKDSGSWTKHANGVGSLIQKRGPNAYMTQWDKAILTSFRSIIIMNALFSGQDCFLAQPQWQALLRKLTLEEPESPHRERRAARDEYFMLLAKVPGIFRHIIPLHEAHENGTIVPVRRDAYAPLVEYTEQTLQNLERWSKDLYRLFTPPAEIPSRDPDSPFSPVFLFDNVWEGSLYMGYWATKLILQYSLQLCQGQVALTEDNRETADNIFRSLETVGAGVMGPFRVSYAIRFAYKVAEPDVQRWIKTLLHRYGKIYASLGETSFPDPGEATTTMTGALVEVDERVPAGLQ